MGRACFKLTTSCALIALLSLSSPSLPPTCTPMSSPTSSGPSYLRTLPAVRERCSKVYALAQAGELEHFDLHEDKLETVVDFCANIIEVSNIPRVT